MIVLAEEFIAKRIGAIGLSLNSKKESGKKGNQFTWLGLQIHPWVSLPRDSLEILQKKVYTFKNKGLIPKDFKPRRKGELKKLWTESIKGKIVFAQSISKNKLLEKISRDSNSF